MSELLNTPSPFGAFKSGIDKRKLELDFLIDHFEPTLEIVGDLDRLNGIVVASPRPDLVLTDPAEQMQIVYPYDRGKLNNFVPHMRAFGPRVMAERAGVLTEGTEEFYNGRRKPTESELEAYFLMGARGDYHEHHAFAEQHGIDEDTAYDTLMINLAHKPAFMRMWIAAPALTQHLMAACLDDRSQVGKNDYEEIFVAYTVMSQLVDKKDPYVQRSEGGKTYYDNWYLCR